MRFWATGRTIPDFTCLTNGIPGAQHPKNERIAAKFGESRASAAYTLVEDTTCVFAAGFEWFYPRA